MDTTALDLVALTAASLNVTAGGAVTDSGTLAIAGATTISASGQDITLDEAASTFGTLALTGANVAVTDAGATDLGASTVSGTLGITSAGAVTDSGTLAITGATTISASGQDITLDEAASTFGTLALTGANVAVTDAGATDLGASTVSGTLGSYISWSGYRQWNLSNHWCDYDQCEWAGHYLGRSSVYFWNACFDWSECGSDRCWSNRFGSKYSQWYLRNHLSWSGYRQWNLSDHWSDYDQCKWSGHYSWTKQHRPLERLP